jgi:hypothetical protein
LLRRLIVPTRSTLLLTALAVAVLSSTAAASASLDDERALATRYEEALRRSLEHPLPAILVLAAIAALIAFALSRTTWRPAATLRIGRRRAWGQILAAAARMYVKRFSLFLGIGILAVPIAVVVTLLQALVLHGSSVVGIDAEGESGGILAFGVLAIGTTLTLLGLGLVQAATAWALVEIDGGRKVSPLHAYRLALGRVWPLLGAVLIVAVAVSLLSTSLFLLPIAIWLAVRWSLVVPSVGLEGRSAIAALRRSGRLVRHGWVKVGSLVVVGVVLVLVGGPLLGPLLILVTSVPLGWLNLIAGVVYAVAMPFVSLATIYVYFDMRVRDELEREPAELPAEIEVSV